MSADLVVRDLTVGSRLGPLELDLPRGRLTVILGPNGAGKSTFLKVLAGLTRPDRGTVRWGGVDLLRVRPVERAAHAAWLPQSPVQEQGVTAAEAVAAARYRHRESARVRDERALDALRDLGVASFAPRLMTTLSGGEAQRVRLAALAAQEASWWLLDEPMNHLDPAVRLELCQVLVERSRQGGSTLLVSHDLGLLPHLGNAHVVVLVDGRVAHRGEARDPDLARPLGQAFGVQLHRVSAGGSWALVVGP